MQILLNLIITLVLSVVAIGLLVFVHELGHFLAAKKMGVVVQEFAFGFGPSLYTKKYKGTDYRLNVVPFGGYVKMLGDADGSSLTRLREQKLTQDEKDYVTNIFEQNNLDLGKDPFDKIYSFYQKQKSKLTKERYSILQRYIDGYYIPNHPGNFDNIRPAKKVVIIIAGIVMNALLGIVLFYIYFALNGGYTDLKKIGNPTFLGAEINTPPILWFDYSTDNLGVSMIINANGRLVRNDSELNKIILQNYNKPINLYILDLSQNKYQNLSLILDGDGIRSNFDKDFTNKVMITTLTAGGTGDEAGLKSGDVIMSVNSDNVATTSIEVFKSILSANRGKAISVNVNELYGENKTFQINLPNVTDNAPIINAGLIKTEDLLTVYDSSLSAIRITYQQYPYLSGVLHTINMSGYNFSAIYELIKQSVAERNIQPVSSSVSSILAVPDIFYTLVKGDNYVEIINIGALVSISLAIMNILPIPLFDGGHLLFIAIEKIRGKKLSAKTEERIGAIAWYSLMALSVLVIIKDVVQFEWITRLINLVGGFFR